MIDTRQRRERIKQLVANRFPSCVAIFDKANANQLAFRISSRTGQFRSGTIRLAAHHEHVRINKAWLEKEIRRSTRPAAD